MGWRNSQAVGPASRLNALLDGELGCAVHADEEKEFALGGLHLGDVAMEESDGVVQAGDAMSLQATVECRTGQFGIVAWRA